MIGSNLQELHGFADLIGLSSKQYHDKNFTIQDDESIKGSPVMGYYVLSNDKQYELAKGFGAVSVNRQQLLDIHAESIENCLRIGVIIDFGNHLKTLIDDYLNVTLVQIPNYLPSMSNLKEIEVHYPEIINHHQK